MWLTLRPGGSTSGEWPDTHCIGGSLGTSVDLERCGKPHAPGFEPQAVLPIVSRCTDWATPALNVAVVKVKVKWSRYRPGVAQRVDTGIVLLFHDCDIRRGWVVSNTPRPHFTPGKDPVPILQEAGWAPGPVRTAGKSRLHRDSIPDRPARS